MGAELSSGADIDRETTVLLTRRLRAGALLCLAATAGFALADVVMARQHLVALTVMKVFAAAATWGAYVAVPHLRSRRLIIFTALAISAVLFALTATSAVLSHEPNTTPLITIAAVLATATLLPWGVGPQLVVVVMGLIAAAVAVAGGSGTVWGLMQYATLGLIIALGVSLYIAAELQRGRAAMARQQAEQRRAEAEIRRLNEHLEARVAARTADLERLTRALRAQISQRAEAESEARRSGAALTALIEYANDAIWSIDRTHRVTAHNAVARQHFAAMFGGPLQTGRPHDPRAAAILEQHWRPFYDRGLAGERFTIEHAFEMADGTRHYRTFFNPIVADGAVMGLAIFSADITERLHAEQAARQHRAELSHVLRLSTMGEMAAGIAHEINQPLGAIVNYAQGSSRRLRDNPEAIGAVLPVIDHIAHEALRAGEIIRRLRSLVRKEPPRQDWIDLADVAADALRLVEPDTYQQGIAVRVEAEPELPRALGDRIQIEQVVLNLLRNAIDAMLDVAERRELSVRIGRVDDTAIELAVSDTGHGLSKAVADRVFDPFFSTKPSGLGMGLSISRTIVEAHQGRLSVSPNVDGGATFRMTLPVGAAVANLSAAAG